MAFVIFLFLLIAENKPVYFYFDDGGEHDYWKKCQKWTGTEKEWKEIKNKLTGANSKKSFLGKNFIEGEISNTVEYYFSDENPCNASLKKSSQWFNKEFENANPIKIENSKLHEKKN